jgi:hypothetical protein
MVDGVAVLNALVFSLVLFAASSASVVIHKSGLAWLSVSGMLSLVSCFLVDFLPVRIVAVTCGIFYLWAIGEAWKNNASCPVGGIHPSDVIPVLLLGLLVAVQGLLWRKTRRACTPQ